MGSTSRQQSELVAMLRPPAGLVLAAGALVILAGALVPGLEGLAEGLPVFGVFTLICWALLGMGQLGPAAALASARSPELATVLRMRDDMEQRISELPEESPLRREFPEVLKRLDQEILPRLRDLVLKHDELGRRLQEYERPGSTYRPDAPTLQRLKGLHARQKSVIQGLVQQVVNMDAALLGVIQEGDEQRMVSRVKEWAEEMDFRWQGLAEVMAEEPPPRRP